MNVRLDILAVGKSMPDWVKIGSETYLKRLPKHWHVNIIDIPPAAREKQANPERYKREEAEHILHQIQAQDTVIALDVKGKSFSTSALTEALSGWIGLGKPIRLLIGGPDGLDKVCLDRATLHWSLSPLTFPHPLVRVILAEQLYRAWSMMNHHPYHRE